MKIDRILKDFILVKVAPLFISNRDIPLDPVIYEGPFRKISFCTTCMGRSMHIKKTLMKNIEDNRNYPNLEFVLVNYNSPDDLHDWASRELSAHVESGIVSYFHTPDPQTFHASKAKNLSHRLATGDILVNLDADNFAGKDAAYFLNHLAKDRENAFFRLRGQGFRFHDTCGRIAVFKSHFKQLGGYDEAMLPFKYQDQDFVKRLEAAGFTRIVSDKVNFIRSIKHPSGLRSNLLGKVDYDDLYRGNQERSNSNIEKGDFIVNLEGFEAYSVFKNFSNESVDV